VFKSENKIKINKIIDYLIMKTEKYNLKWDKSFVNLEIGEIFSEKINDDTLTIYRIPSFFFNVYKLEINDIHICYNYKIKKIFDIIHNRKFKIVNADKDNIINKYGS
jgi:hypothetical protein